MKQVTKQSKQNLKMFKIFLTIQLSTLVIAAAINTIILVPNKFKQEHKTYLSCLNQPRTKSSKDCVKPYKK